MRQTCDRRMKMALRSADRYQTQPQSFPFDLCIMLQEGSYTKSNILFRKQIPHSQSERSPRLNMASPYQPLELGQTRILCLYPGKRGTPLHGYLEILQLSDMSSAKPYSAVSYAWISPLLPENIQVLYGVNLPITTSLHGALQRFRHSTAKRRIWADAVCISQTDIEEKSAQVLGIKDVFAQAHEILIWLGESTALDSLVFMQLYRRDAHRRIRDQDKTRTHDRRIGQVVDDIRVLDDAIIANTGTCHCCDEPIPAHAMEDCPPEPYNTGPLNRTALQDLLSRPWFTRLWVAQEVTTAATDQTIILHCEPLPQTSTHSGINLHCVISWLPSHVLAEIRRSHTISPRLQVPFELATHVRTSVCGFGGDWQGAA